MMYKLSCFLFVPSICLWPLLYTGHWYKSLSDSGTRWTTSWPTSITAVSKNKIKTRKTLVLHACSTKLPCLGMRSRHGLLSAGEQIPQPRPYLGKWPQGCISPQMWNSGPEPCILWATQWHSACPILWDTSTPASSLLQTPSNFLLIPAVRKTEFSAAARKLQKVFVLPTGHDVGNHTAAPGFKWPKYGFAF